MTGCGRSTSSSSRWAPPTGGAWPTPRSPASLRARRRVGRGRRRRERPREVRTFALTDLLWALAARRGRGARHRRARAAGGPVLDDDGRAARGRAPAPSATTTLAQANRPGRHGLWQRPRERRGLAAAPLLVPMGHAAARGRVDDAGASSSRRRSRRPGRRRTERDIAAHHLRERPGEEGRSTACSTRGRGRAGRARSSSS